MKKFCIAAALVLLMSLPTGLASAEEVEKEVQVTGGSLQVTATKLLFTDIVLKVKEQQKSTASSTIHVLDDRGNGAGSGLSVAATDFVTTVSVDGQQKEFKIPASSVRFTTTFKGNTAGVQLDFPSNGAIASSEVLSSTPTSIYRIDPGFGQGAYDFQVDYVLNLPHKIQADDGKEIGVMAGTYKAKITYTATSGI